MAIAQTSRRRGQTSLLNGQTSRSQKWKLRSDKDTWPAIITMAIEGDSISFQDITGVTSFNAIGIHNALNAISGHRFPYRPAENFAASGATLTQMEASKVTEIGTMTAQLLALLGGANDVGVVMADGSAAATVLATMKAKWTSLKDYATVTLGKPLLDVTLMPRTQDAGVALTALQLGVLKDFNAWKLGQHSIANKVLVADVYPAMVVPGTDNPNPDYFKDESGKRLHPNTAGAFAGARSIWTMLQACGFRANALPDPVVGNLFAYGNLAGNGGTISTNADGVVATGAKLSGSGGAQKRTGSKNPDDSQRIVFAPLAGDGGSVTYILESAADIVPVAGNYAVGDKVFAWAEVTIHDAILSDGPFLQITDKNSGGNIAYYGMNKGGNTTGYMPANAGRFYMRTPVFQVAVGHTGFLPQVRGQINAASAPGLIDMTVHRWGVCKTSLAV